MFKTLKSLRLCAVAFLMLMSLSACSSLPFGGNDESKVPSMTNTYADRVARETASQSTNKGYYKVGRAYKIKGKTYHPKADFSYDETGIASWYGARFHGKKTANGEIFNKNELTAAHKTLPMPCLARVTNLENGRSLVVRINDRGPFSGKRIIDLSQRSAKLLGFERQGVAKVRVQVLKEESMAIADAMRNYGTYNKQVNAGVPAPIQQKTLATFKPQPVVEQVAVTGSTNIYVQAGAFTDVDNARRLKELLDPIGRTVMAQAFVKNTRFYRVRVGPISSVALADRMIDRVISAGAEDARIVVD